MFLKRENRNIKNKLWKRKNNQYFHILVDDKQPFHCSDSHLLADKPVVKVIMDPETPVNEADRQNVSLTCEVVTGNPASLTAVRWYLDGDLLKELPDCTRNSSATTTTTEESLIFCDIDPSKLLLEAVGRSFHGNYSCEGRNDAGWGPLSPSAPVMVHCESPF